MCSLNAYVLCMYVCYPLRRLAWLGKFSHACNLEVREGWAACSAAFQQGSTYIVFGEGEVAYGGQGERRKGVEFRVHY